MRLNKNQRWAIAFTFIFGLTGWFWYDYAGPYRWLAELQIRWFGSYEMKLTVVLTMLAVMLPVFAITSIPWVKRRFDLSPMTDEEQADAAKLFDENTVIPWWPLVIATFCFVPGLYMSVQVWSLGDLTATDIAELQSGAPPRSNWVDLSAHARGSLMVGYQEGTPKKTKNNYVPLVAEGWEAGQPVTVYVELDGEKMLSDSTVTLRGRLVRNGLPGMIREAFARSAAPPAAEHWLLQNDFDPAFSGPFGKVLLIIAGIMYAVAFVLFLLYRTANRRGGWTRGPANPGERAR